MGAKHGTWAIEIKLSEAPNTSKGLRSAMSDIQPDKTFIVYSGNDRYPKTESIEVISLPALLNDLLALH